MRPVNFKSDHWLKLSSAVKHRDGNRCYVCNGTDRTSAHHITPRRVGGRSIPRNLITLCVRCHDEAELADNTWIWIQMHKKHSKKTSIKFNDKEPPQIPLKPGQSLRFSKSDGKWRIWGRDHLGLYAIEVDPSMDERSLDIVVPQ